MTPIVLFDKVADLFLRDLRLRASERSVANVKTMLVAFQRERGNKPIEAYVPFDVDAFCGAGNFVERARRDRRTTFYRFFEFARVRFPHLPVLFIGPTARKRQRLSAPAHTSPSVQVQKALDAMPALAEHMKLPHQRAVFLLGFLCGKSLREVQALTWTEVSKLPLRSDLYAALTLVQKGTFEESVFKRWLGTGAMPPYRVWNAWSGGVPFRYTRMAGDVARVRLGYRPYCSDWTAGGLLAQLPEMGLAAVEQLPKFWLLK